MVDDMRVDVNIEGTFYCTNNMADHTKPVHRKKQASSLHLKGDERKKLAQLASSTSPQQVFLDQMAYARKDEIDAFNKTSIRNLPVIKTAMHEEEKTL